MTYANKQDMIDRFTEVELQQLTDRDNTVSAINDTVLNQALADAGAEIDGYLAGRYTLPLATTPRVLTNLECDIARYRLYDDRATEQVAKRYEDALRMLKMFAEGKLSLGLDTVGTPVPSAGAVQYSAPARVFSADTLKDY